jgi:hypothetical protein
MESVVWALAEATEILKVMASYKKLVSLKPDQ